MNKTLYFCIFGEPVVKKNNRPIYTNSKTKKPFVGKSEKLSSAERNIMAQIARHDWGKETLKPPYHVSFCMVLPHNRRKDVSNAWEIYADCLQKMGVISDDNDIIVLNMVKFRGQKKQIEAPFVTIEITEVDEVKYAPMYESFEDRRN